MMILLISLLPHSPYPHSSTIPLDLGIQLDRVSQGMGKMLMVMPVKQISHHSYPRLSCTPDHPFSKYIVFEELRVDTTVANIGTSYNCLYLNQRDLLRITANLKLSHPCTHPLPKILNFHVVGGYSWNFHHH